MSGALRAIAYGGGVQSTALVVLAAQGEIDFDYALFSNVGDDSEHPATLKYVREVMMPWVDAVNGPQIIELQRTMQRGERAGEVETLHARLTRKGSRSIPIPLRGSDTGAPGGRSCTVDFKVNVLGRWLKENGASEDEPAALAIGISLDEYHRASNKRQEPYEVIEYPLLDLGLARVDCQRIIAEAGLPVPPKSSCYFCPYHRPQHWREMRRDEPDLFEKAARLEDHINNRPDRRNKDPMYLTRFGKPLREAIPVAQPQLFTGDAWATMDNDGECDEGYCFV